MTLSWMVTERVLIHAKRIATILLHVLTQWRINIWYFLSSKKRWWQPKFNPKTDKFPLWDQNFNEKTRKFEIGFYFNWNFEEHRKDKIRIKFEEFARDTCIQMVEVKRDNPAFKNKMAIKKCCGCSSFVGRIHKEQMVSLASGCESSNLPLHEVRIFINTKRLNESLDFFSR